MSLRFLHSINGTKVRRPTATPHPYADGLDSVIAFFTEIREYSIDAQEQIVREHPEATGGQPILELPAATLDALLLDLKGARDYRNALHEQVPQMKAHVVAGFALGAVAFVIALLSLVLVVW